MNKLNEKNVKKVYIDTEFIDNGSTIELISIGLVDDNDKTLYLVADFDINNCDQWLLDNVVSKLGGDKKHSKKEIKQKIVDFLGEDKIEFWGYYSSYDWVVFCQIFGKMLDLPDNYNFYCNDLKQELNRLNVSSKGFAKGDVHNALDDAKWNKKVHEHLTIEAIV